MYTHPGNLLEMLMRGRSAWMRTVVLNAISGCHDVACRLWATHPGNLLEVFMRGRSAWMRTVVLNAMSGFYYVAWRLWATARPLAQVLHTQLGQIIAIGYSLCLICLLLCTCAVLFFMVPVTMGYALCELLLRGCRLLTASSRVSIGRPLRKLWNKKILRHLKKERRLQRGHRRSLGKYYRSWLFVFKLLILYSKCVLMYCGLKVSMSLLIVLCWLPLLCVLLCLVRIIHCIPALYWSKQCLRKALSVSEADARNVVHGICRLCGTREHWECAFGSCGCRGNALLASLRRVAPEDVREVIHSRGGGKDLGSGASHSGGLILDEVDFFDATDIPGLCGPDEKAMASQWRLGPVKHLQGVLHEGTGDLHMAAQTNGDGACALHSCWGSIVPYDGWKAWFECTNARGDLLDCMPEDVTVLQESDHSDALAMLLQEVGRDLVRQARVLFCGDALEVSDETAEVWTLLPEAFQSELEQFTKGLEYESAQQVTLENALAADCRLLFTLDNMVGSFLIRLRWMFYRTAM